LVAVAPRRGEGALFLADEVELVALDMVEGASEAVVEGAPGCDAKPGF